MVEKFEDTINQYTNVTDSKTDRNTDTSRRHYA